MKYYPVNLNISRRNCLVVGGGPVAFRKVKLLLECGAQVSVVSLKFISEFSELKDTPSLQLHQREYMSSDLEGKFLVISATDNEELNRRVSKDAEKQNMLYNIADAPQLCNFILPSVISRGDLIITVSTSGTSPAFAKQLRKNLEKEFGDEYARFLDLMGRIRKKLLETEHEPEAHKPLFKKLIHSGLLEMIKNNQTDDINRLLAEVLGDGYSYEQLIK